MKPLALAGCVLLIILGCVLAAGCTGMTEKISETDAVTVTSDEELHNALTDAGDKPIQISYDFDLNTYNKKFFTDFKKNGEVCSDENADAILNTNGHVLIIAPESTLYPHAHLITDDGTFKNRAELHNKEILSFSGTVVLDKDSTTDIYQNIVTGGKNARAGENSGVVDVFIRYDDDFTQRFSTPGSETYTFHSKGATEDVLNVIDTKETYGLSLKDTITTADGAVLKVAGRVGCEGIYTVLDGDTDISSFNDKTGARFPTNSVMVFPEKSVVTVSDRCELTAEAGSHVINDGVFIVKKGASFKLADGSEFINNGEFVVEDGAKYTVSETAVFVNNGKASGI